METRTGNSDPDASVIDLGPISHACRQLVDWYDRQIAGASPTVTDLEPAMALLQELPAIPGRLGEDIDLIASGGDTYSPGEVVSAIERLRLMANHNSNGPLDPAQDQLPGFNDPEADA